MDPRETDHLDETYRRVRRAVRDASGGEPDAGAAQRIADGAWAQVHGKAPSARRGRGRILPFPRIVGLSAAAALMAAVLFGMRGPETAFAVVGDPVQVHESGSWAPATKVREGQIVHAPQGTRTLRAQDGSEVVPVPGSVFRVLRSDGPIAIRVELLRGQLDADGERLAVVAGDVLATRDLGAPRLDVRVTLGESADPAEDTPPADPQVLVATLDARPRVQALTSHVLLSLTGSGETLRLKPAESAARVDVLGEQGVEGARERLAFVRHFTDEIQGRVLTAVASGDKAVIDAQHGRGGNVRVVIGGMAGPLELLDVPDARGAEFLSTLNAVTFETAISVHVAGFGIPRGGAVRAVAAPTRAGPTEYVMEKDGERVSVLVDERGAVAVEGGDTRQVYASLAALRAAAPEIVELFEGRLPTE